MGSTNNFHVAILQNYLSSENGGQHMIQNISDLVLNSKPNAVINVYAPIQSNSFPDFNNYDLIILTGGPFNLLGDEKPAWVTGTLDFIKAATTGRTRPKILGICWGQQAVALALGGSLGESKRGFCMGVETISLTSAGATFFNAKSLEIHKQHMLVVTDIGPQLSCLALNNEILLSKDNQILTFQGHPELDPILSQLLIGIDNPSYCARPEHETAIKGIDAPDDGRAIFATVMRWASDATTEAVSYSG
ncbi:Glutamine amidotransferase-like protein chry6 [Cladobotryum mycophilum]|uniref:Glutamine amidotransferase-like protein chry6 n=1 Tax=Cladobotryum mycophilum TaxID=491253 RepID=A0ABR0SQ93_9HYPO